MKTQTEVEIKITSLEPYQNLHIEPQGYVLKFFMGCSQIFSKPFKIIQSDLTLNQVLKIKNIYGDQLQIWLCNIQDKIIANASLPLNKQTDEQYEIQLKLNAILFAKLYASLSIVRRQIQKIIYVEPDQQLLKKQEDSLQAKIREQGNIKRINDKKQQEKLTQKQKKHPITVTYRNKINQPFQ